MSRLLRPASDLAAALRTNPFRAAGCAVHTSGLVATSRTNLPLDFSRHDVTKLKRRTPTQGLVLQGVRRMTTRPPVRVTMYTKEDCYLCDVVKSVMDKCCIPFELEKVDITAPGNEHVFAQYKHDIPIVHVNGKFFAKHRMQLTEFEDALRLAQKGEFRGNEGEPELNAAA